MKIARFAKDNVEYVGVLENGMLKTISEPFWEAITYTGKEFPLEDVQLKAPVYPAKVFCIGLNYIDHMQEMGVQPPSTPVVFLKPQETIVGCGEAVIYPTHLSKRLDYEGELAVIIKKRGKHVKKEDAKEYIFGYTCGNDITARDLQSPDGQWSIAKGFDTFLPLGPVIETEFDPKNAALETCVNGARKQYSNTANLCFDCEYLVSYLSEIFTLNPGDVIVTGTPSGIGPMEIGDVVTVSIAGIGTLQNPIV